MSEGNLNGVNLETSVDYYARGTNICPEVLLENGILYLKGRALTEDSNITKNVFDPVMSQLETWILSEKLKIVAIDLAEFNVHNSKYLLKLMNKYAEKINLLNPKPKDAKVIWYYADGDEDMQDAGEDFEQLVPMRFNYVKKE